jgi:membrane associated rhomboid family serine protease
MTQPPSVGTPVCYRHPSRETWVSCTRCDRPICPDCMNAASVGHQCPECVAEGRKTQRQVRTAFGGTTAGQRGTVTKTLIAVNIAVAGLGVLLSGTRSLFNGGMFTGASLIHYIGATSAETYYVSATGQLVSGPGPGVHTFPGIADGGWYRLVTAMFIHYGIIHLALNMWALWILGRQLEAALGRTRFLALYLVAGIGGNVASYLFEGGLAAGASTALFGLFAAFAIVVRRLGGSLAGILPLLAINLYLTFVIPGISIAGHIGGLITGAIVAAGLAYAPRNQYRTRVQVATIVGTLLLLAFLTVVGPSLPI